MPFKSSKKEYNDDKSNHPRNRPQIDNKAIKINANINCGITYVCELL